jgi:hypothetical protein
MATCGQPPNAGKWRTCGAATLLVAAFAGFADVQAETLSGLDGVTANVPGGILEQPAVSRVTMPARSRQKSSLTGNPLWEVSLSALQETRARPLFSPSRRPPTLPVIAAPPPPPPKPPAPKEPELLKLTLVGTVIGAADGIGIFVDETSKDVVRIRTGESHAGWTLRSIHRHSANFEKGHQETTLVFPTPGSEQRSLSAGAAATKPGGASVPAAPVVPIIPVSAPATRSAQKVRQESLSIRATN